MADRAVPVRSEVLVDSERPELCGEGCGWAQDTPAPRGWQPACYLFSTKRRKGRLLRWGWRGRLRRCAPCLDAERQAKGGG